MDSLPTPIEPCGSRAPAAGIGPLLAAARAGCAESLGELTQRYRRYLLLVAHHELSPELRARVADSDLVQETLLYARQSIERFVGTSEAELLAWLRKILHLRAMQAVRHHTAAARDVVREKPIGSVDESGSQLHPADGRATPCTQLVRRERLAALDDAIDRLPEDCRQIINLRSVERRRFDEIGELVGCSADAAQKRWMRAVARLRDDLRGHE